MNRPIQYLAYLCGAALIRGVLAQTDAGGVAGSVIDSWNAQPLPGVTVMVRGTTLATTTDATGQYRIELVPPGDQALRFSKPGYASAVVTDVRVLAGQTTRVDGVLRPEFFEMEEYTVTAEEFREEAVQLLQERQESSAMLEIIGTERFSRLAAGDAAEIMTKITGVSVVEGKFAVIRGLSERYNIAMLNGADVPSADPYRRAAQLDLFPAEVIESVSVSKTFTPDLPGGFSGGAMDIRTKSFPDKFLFKTGAGVGLNTQSTGNRRFLTYPGGGTDWLAMDDGTRSLPSALGNVTGTDLQRLAQTATSGSLSIPLEDKTAAADTLDSLVRSFGSPHMGPTRDEPPFDHDFNILAGDTVKLAGAPVGYFASFSYEGDFRFYENGVRRRYVPQPGTSEPHVYQQYEDSRGSVLAQWSALATLSTRLFDHHSLDYSFLFTQNAEDMARSLFGQIESSGEDQFNDQRRTHLNILQWTERNLLTHQFRGSHRLPALNDLETAWLLSVADTSQDEPDLRYFNFISYPNPQNTNDTRRGVDVSSNNTPFPDRPTRYFRHLEDQNLNAKLDLTLPFEDWRNLPWEAKAGVFTSQSDRRFSERTFSYTGGTGSIVDTDTFPFEYLTGTNAPPPQLIQQGNRSRYAFSRILSSQFGNSFYDGSQDIYAVYGMVEVPLIERLRVSGGVRCETTLLDVSSSSYGSSRVFTGLIDEADLLPAVSLSWLVNQEMKARLSYAETVARPTYREFARYRGFDVAGDQIVEGNPFLKMTHVQNIDGSWEWFTPGGGLLSVGGFYKVLTDPIEKFNATLSPLGEVSWTASGDFVTFLNTTEATAWGIEVEARQNLSFVDSSLKPFSLGLNAAWIETEVALEPEIQRMKLIATGQETATRPLFDQSPYIINAEISYENSQSGTAVTLAWYYAAERLSLIVNNGWDIYEQAAPSLDLVISQELGKGFKAKFTARNLLDPEIIRSYAVSGSTDTQYLYSSYTRGMTFGLSFSYEY